MNYLKVAKRCRKIQKKILQMRFWNFMNAGQNANARENLTS